MGKVTTAQITDEGFIAQQFGTPADWATADTGYLARLMADASSWVQRKVTGTDYSAATGAMLYALKMAELCYCKSVLWRRRAAFLDSNAFSQLDQSPAAERKAYMEQSDSAWQCALDWLATAAAGGEVDVTGGTGVSLNGAESGPYATAADSVIAP